MASARERITDMLVQGAPRGPVSWEQIKEFVTPEYARSQPDRVDITRAGPDEKVGVGQPTWRTVAPMAAFDALTALPLGGAKATATVLPLALMRGKGAAKGAAKATDDLLKEIGDAVSTKSRAPFPQYAEQYPPVGAPVTAYDKVKKAEYLAKELTPEAQAFQKARAAIMKDMKTKGYEPYFDPAQRAYVDPSNYPPNVNTRDIVPKKQATIEKDMEKIGSAEARQRLRAAYERGSKLPDAADWYAMKQLEDEFVKELGPEAGREAFKNQFATSMAATTGGADPTSNLLMGQYGNYLRQRGQPLPEASHQYPFPIGGRYAANNMDQYMKVMGAGGFEALGAANPKRHNFAQNFMGNRNVATMDEQMTSGMTPGVMMPPPGKYGLYEGVLHEEAAKAGVPPANYQDVGWAGFKQDKEPGFAGQPMISVVNDAIERTHRLTGMPKKEIVQRGLVRGEIPIYGGGAAAVVAPGAMGEWAAEDRYQ